MDDARLMKRALMLAARARGRTSPNPMVGAVLVRDGRIISEGYHKKAGTPHAEALTLAKAQSEAGGAAGATMYVTLEPCCHTNKRTPPCTKALIAAGIKKVFVAMADPNPLVSGKGIEELKRAGIEVEVGLGGEEARLLNEAYIKFITTGRPFVILKTAMTLDGKIATPTGESKWITGEKARRLVHRIRGQVDAVITAIGTVRADDPELTARVPRGRDPMRVVIDPKLSIPDGARLLKTPPETVIVTSARSQGAEGLESAGIRMLYYGENLHMDWLMGELAAMGVVSAMIEGGGTLNSYALNDGVVDKVMFFIAPKIIGGKDSLTPVGGALFKPLSEAFAITDLSVRRLGEDILIEGRVGHRA